MKNLKKMLAVLVVISMISTFFVPALAAEDSYTYEAEAEKLYELGLYKGTSTTVYEPNLGGKLDRQTGVVMLLRLFGQEEEALQMATEDAATKLAAKFTDAAEVADWAQRQVAYAVEKGYVRGLPDGTFAPTADLNGKAYCSLILQQLGYDGDFTYDTAAFDLSSKGGLTEAQAQIFNSNAGINRDSMVGISFSTLQGVYKESGKTVIEVLVENGNVDKDLAIEVGVLKKEIKSVAELEDVKVTIGETPALPAEVEVTYVDDTTATLPITWPTVNTSEIGEQEVEGDIGYKDVTVTVKVIVQPAELLVDSVEMDNLVEIVINFNGEVEAGKADEKDNYSVDGKTIKSATISEDNTSVTLLLEDKAEQGEELEVTVNTGAGLETEVTEKVTALDRTLPEAESASLTGPNSFEVVFTEPVQETDDAEISINDGTYGVSESKLSDSGRVLSVTLGVSSLSEGTYKIRVKGYKDYADFSILPKTFDVEYEKDETAPVATIKSASQNKVEIEFNKAVYRDGFYGEEAALTVDYFYHTYSAWKPNAVETSDNKVYTLKFEGEDDDKVYLLPEGNVTITVLKKVDDAAVVDAWGNEMEDDAKLTATVVADNEAPVATKVEAEAEDKIVVTFDEDVEKADAEDADNYTIKKGGEEVDATISDIDYSSEDKQATIQLDAKLSGGTYTIDIKDIRDSSVSKNRMNAVTLEFEVTDKTAPELVEATYLEEGGNIIIYATFNEEMKTSGDGSVLNKDNYRLDGKALPEGVTLAMFGSDGKKVKITFKEEKFEGTAEDLEDLDLIARVADKAGNSVNAWGEGIEDLTASIKKEEVPEVKEVRVISADKIEIVINKKLSSYPANGFIVVKDGTRKPLGGISYKYEDGKSIITGTLQSGVKPNDPSDVDGYKLEIVEGKIQSDTGKYLEPGVVVEGFKDKYAPSFKDIKPVALGSVNGIKIEFDEEVVLGDLAATDLVVTDRKGNTLVAGKDYTVVCVAVDEDGKLTFSEDGDVVTAESSKYIFINFEIAVDDIESGDYKVSTKDKVFYIFDKKDNVINTFKDKKAKLKDKD